MRLLFALALCLPAPVNGHEYWIEPEDYTVAPDASVQAGLYNGQNFAGVEFPFFADRMSRFDLALGEQVVPVAGRMGDVPALAMAPLGEGLHVAIFESSGDVVNYDDFAVFTRFVLHKDFPGALARHAERALPQTGFREYYTRHAKALIAVGAGAGQDRVFGLETEIVALRNPYTDDVSAGLPVQVFYQGRPRADTQVELFAKAPDRTVTVTLMRTDAEGVALLPVAPGMSYLADAVVLREPDAETAAAQDAVWESLWAALTFAVPE
jgi:uncharacterized GH25 family protein